MNEDRFAEGLLVGQNSGYNNGFGFGNGWEGLIGLALVAGLFGGWGNGGFGFGGGRGYGAGSGVADGYALITDMATLERKLDSIANGICDSTFALNNTIVNGDFALQNSLTQGFAGLNTVINTGFNGVDRAICTLGYNQAQLVNGLSNQIASCCCDLKTMNLENRYLNEKQTCEIVNAINAGNQRLVDIYTNDKLDALRTENASLKGQISNDRQSRFIIDELRNGGCPIPSYVVQPSQPVTFPTDCCGNVNYANFNKGCGCY
jgi:hypothetical protein